MHESAIFPYYFMDNEFFAFINFVIFLNGNLLLLGNRRGRGWNCVIFLTISTQLLLLTYYAVIGYQSHPIAIALIILNIILNLLLVVNGGFQWVTVRWVGPY
ncbi:MAG: hypothetical protein B6U86_00775 [Candidatus Altiarchaeales archaeon ex4484_43]|nr:MAG: hypothetical protein B6U86_00775 [Candidatus Altiarchaeales archaeon ex4484_43]